MSVYAKCPETSNVYLTSGKLYPVSDVSEYGFEIIDDNGGRIYCQWKGCAHANGDWERIEIDEAATIDWTKPLELMDGTPVQLKETGFCGGPNPDEDGDYWVCNLDGSEVKHTVFPANGVHRDDMFLRNRAEPEYSERLMQSVSQFGETPTLRDQFAMAALTGMTANNEYTSVNGDLATLTAIDAYRFADAMMDARK